MPLYRYKAVDAHGIRVKGKIDAINATDLEARLRHMELDLIDGKALVDRRWLAPSGVSRREIIHFCFHLEQLTRAAVPIRDGLADLRDSLEQARFREVVASLIESIDGGETLSQALARHGKIFGAVFVSLIRSGEATGKLPQVLRSLIDSLKWEDELAVQTRKLLIYPAFIGVVVVAATLFLMIYMVPQLKQFVKNMGQALPLHTQALFFVADLVADYWYLALIVPLAVVLSAKAVVRVDPLARLRLDRLTLCAPFVGDVVRRVILARFANTLALLYASGIPIIDAIRTTQDVAGNMVVRQGLERVEQLIGDGQKLTAAFQRVGLFPPLVIRMLRVGEATGALDTALLNVAYFYDRDVKDAVGRAQQLVEPLLTVVLGCLLGWIMLSVLGPVYDVISQIRL